MDWIALGVSWSLATAGRGGLTWNGEAGACAVRCTSGVRGDLIVSCVHFALGRSGPGTRNIRAGPWKDCDGGMDPLYEKHVQLTTFR